MQSDLFSPPTDPAPSAAPDIRIEESWKAALAHEFAQPYFADIKSHLLKEREAGQVVYPPGPLIFNAFNTTPLPDVKVVILGQDPYHGRGQAHGLCFSVPDGVKAPPSLVNIFKEIQSDLGHGIAAGGNLLPWARQGVFLLNAILTVRAAQPASHQKIGWELFTDAVIRTISDKQPHVVFMLWGKFAQGKAELVNTKKHLVLTAPHPSPYSASNGFFGCRHFSKANHFLEESGMSPINWAL